MNKVNQYEGEQTRPGVFQSKVLIVEGFTVDGDATGTIAVGEIPALTHKLWDDAVEWRPLVADALLTGAEGAEVLGCFGHHIGSQLHDHAAHRYITDGDVKKHLRVRWVAHGRLTLRCFKIFRFGVRRHRSS